jgi:alkylglycerol monooxygenase
MRAGQIDAMSNLDPVITLLQRSGDLKIVTDTRIVAESEKVFGGPMPAACLYAPQAFIDKNPATVQALANAIVRADKWIQPAGPSEIINTVPESYLLGDRAVYIDAFLAAKGALSPDGLIPRQGRRHGLPRAGQHRRRDRQGQARPGRGLHQRLRQEGQRQVSEGVKTKAADRRPDHRAGHAGLPAADRGGMGRRPRRGRNTYRLADALASIGLGVLSQLVAVFTQAVRRRPLRAGLRARGAVRLPADALVGVGRGAAGLRLLLLLAATAPATAWRCCGRRMRCTTRARTTTSAPRCARPAAASCWLGVLPAAGAAGVPPLVFGTVALIDLLYQFWVHTQQVGRLGWFDRWFCSPSNHRVHHAVNDRYLDKNYGGILVVWDRLFGSFADEDDAEPCVYGTRSPLRSWNPLWANLQVYRDLARQRRAARWADKLRVWLKPPGWRPADVAARWPKPGFRHPPGAALRPAAERRPRAGGPACLPRCFGGRPVPVGIAHELAPTEKALAALAIVGLLWLIGAITQPARTHGPASLEPRMSGTPALALLGRVLHLRQQGRRPASATPRCATCR